MTTSASSSARARAACTRRASSSTASSNSGRQARRRMLFSNTVGNAAASLVALEEKLRGPNTTVSYKEASGLAAAALATDLVRAGKAGALVTGRRRGHLRPLLRGARLVRRALARRRRFRKVRGRSTAPGTASSWARAALSPSSRSAAAPRRAGAPVLAEVLGVGATVGHHAGQRLANGGRHRWCGACAPRSPRAASRPDRSAPSMRRPTGRWTSTASKREAIAEVFGGRAVRTTSIKGAVGEGGMAGRRRSSRLSWRDVAASSRRRPG